MKRTLIALFVSAALLAAAPATVFAQPQAAPSAATASPSKLVLDNSTRILSTLEARRAEFRNDRGALRDYHVTDPKTGQLSVVIVDEYTGRVMADRSWSDGLHQLVEAKEGCEITSRKTPLARMTYQAAAHAPTEKATMADPMGSGPKDKGRRSWVAIVVMAFLCILWTVPTLGLLVTSFRSRDDIVNSGWWTAARAVYVEPREQIGWPEMVPLWNKYLADITPLALTAGIVANDKVYDGTTAATLTGGASLTEIGRASWRERV